MSPAQVPFGLDVVRFAAGFTATVAVSAVALRLIELAPTGKQIPSPAYRSDRANGLGEAVEIMAGNLRVLTLILGAAVLARYAPVAARAITAVLLAIALLNAILLAAALASSPAPTLQALANHGPLELMAFSVAAAFYHRRAERPKVAVGGITCVALLALAALAEVRFS